ncbi:hypothetical protein DQG23_26700 [Paenibacillus contaminans]|uniref:Copper amine oxidase-like N-terminal domain-containing protein n=2 Tax=Paenibacillus contaminans TaxID=450362 RepID=A0A329MCI4_9BACL|nr:hypothetical protein DQG23_26700 [Paenibacillus contaminans]
MTLLFFLLVSVVPMQAAASSSVKATIPPFPLKINGQEMDLLHSKYPFLFYKDITYLPLTWNNLQALGIESQWSEAEGLIIWANRNYPVPIRETPPEQDLTDAKRKSGTFSALLSDGPITMNAISIKNASEPYPFLSYQDVTYMPLTWRFVHDILQIDIRWSEKDGLHLIGGQNVFGSLLGDDDQSLYFYSMLSADPAKSVIKMNKSSYALEWKGREDLDKLLGSRSESTTPPPLGGKPVELQRKDRDLYYGDLKIYTLTDSDVWEAADFGPPVHTYTEYSAGDQGVIISINLRLPLPVIGPNYGSTYNIWVKDGKATILKDFRNKLDRVIPNPDGTVWIAAARLPGRNMYIPGTAILGLIDREGNIRTVNEQLDEADVLALGLTNPALPNPAAEDGSLYAVFLGRKKDFSEQDSAGLYKLNTKLEAVRLSDYANGEFYLDKNRTIYIQHANNTIENWTAGETRSWFDYELARME